MVHDIVYKGKLYFQERCEILWFQDNGHFVKPCQLVIFINGLHIFFEGFWSPYGQY